MQAEYDKDHSLLKLYFNPSTIETIDRAMMNYVEKLKLFSETNKGWKKVPVIWASAERAFQSKKDSEIRDASGMLKLPLITVARTEMTKDPAKRAAFHGNVPEINDEQGGAIATHRVIYQDKSRNFAHADNNRMFNQSGFPRENKKKVYKTISVPMPVNISVKYDILIRTEYQQQLNDLMLPFITKPGTLNFVSISEEEHKYEAFIDQGFTQTTNLDNYTSEERRFETKISVSVIGYLVGEGKNRERPHFAVRENFVEIKTPRERISLREIPDHEYGAYYGLAGVTMQELVREFGPSFVGQNFSNIPAIGAGFMGGFQNSGNVVTTNNFSTVLNEFFAFRELIKDTGEAAGRNFTTSKDVKSDSETIFVDGQLQFPGANRDYTILNRNITFNYNIDEDSTVFCTYIIDR